MALIPTTITSHPLIVAPITSASSNGVDKIEAMMQTMIQNMDKIKDYNYDMDKRF